jgi:hypothetical protein
MTRQMMNPGCRRRGGSTTDVVRERTIVAKPRVVAKTSPITPARR